MATSRLTVLAGFSELKERLTLTKKLKLIAGLTKSMTK